MSRRDHNPPAVTAPLSPEEIRLIVRQVSYLFAQLDRCGEEKRRLRDYEMERAKLRWDQDRRHEAEMLAAGLSRRPAPVRSKLGQTKHGVLWLIGQWTALAAILETNGDWKPAQVALAFDLLGVSKPLREGSPWGIAGLDTAQKLVGREISALQAQLEGTLERLDEAEREAAEDGYPLERSAAETKLRREEAAYWRRLLALQRRTGRPITSAPADEPAADEPADDEPEAVEPASPPPPPARVSALAGPPPLPLSARRPESHPLRAEPAREAGPARVAPGPLDGSRRLDPSPTAVRGVGSVRGAEGHGGLAGGHPLGEPPSPRA